MRIFLQISALLPCAVVLAGCVSAPGKPAPGSATKRPDQVLDFATLYAENCSACHGEHGRMGAAISLANPAYLTFAGPSTIERVTANGVPGTMMPPFGQRSGGMLTDQQIQVLAEGMVKVWGDSRTTSGISTMPYGKTLAGDPIRGASAFATTCAGCHGAGTGGSLVDPAYLALISDQGLRSFTVAGHPKDAIPTMTDQQVTDMVAWLATHRSETPGQPYQQYPESLQRRPQ